MRARAHEMIVRYGLAGRFVAVIAATLVVASAATSSAARAQSTGSSGPPASPSAGVYPEAPFVLGAPEATADLQPPAPSQGGWALFGGELGFFVGGTLGVTTTLLTMPDDPGGEGAAALYALGTSLLVVGTTVGGALLFRSLARENAWRPDAGWGATGVFPGVMAGIALAGGTMLSADANPATETRIGVTCAGAIVGGTLGYLLFREMARPNRGVGWQTLAFWIGFLVGEVVGIVATQDSAGGTPTDERGRALLFGAAAGGIGAAALTHLIVRAAD